MNDDATVYLTSYPCFCHSINLNLMLLIVSGVFSDREAGASRILLKSGF